MLRLSCILIIVGAAFWPGQDPKAPAAASPLPALVATERAFAAATAEMGVRNGFLTFLANDAVTTDPIPGDDIVTVVSARPRLLVQPTPTGPSPTRLEWRPFTGQIATDGSLGWLTGPYANRTVATGVAQTQGAYFSVWRRQADSTWRVWLDLGVSMPTAWDPGAAFQPADPPHVADFDAEPIDAVEGALAQKPDEWLARLAPDARLHVSGQLPLVGRSAMTQWRKSAPTMRERVKRTVLSESEDVAVVLGGYEFIGGPTADRGTLVRVWQRAAPGRWAIVFQTLRKFQ
jgi:hypothetical protein